MLCAVIKLSRRKHQFNTSNIKFYTLKFNFDWCFKWYTMHERKHIINCPFETAWYDLQCIFFRSFLVNWIEKKLSRIFKCALNLRFAEKICCSCQNWNWLMAGTHVWNYIVRSIPVTKHIIFHVSTTGKSSSICFHVFGTRNSAIKTFEHGMNSARNEIRIPAARIFHSTIRQFCALLVLHWNAHKVMRIHKQ